MKSTLSFTLLALVCALLLWNYCEARKTPADHNAAEDRAWLKWKAANNKNYSQAEEPKRRANWASNYHGYKSLKKQKAFTKGFLNEHGETVIPLGAGGPNGLADIGSQCASCWSFTVTGAIEAALAKETGRLVSLSEQYILDSAADCMKTWTGCNGGGHTKAYGLEIVAQKGLPSEANYDQYKEPKSSHTCPGDVQSELAGYKMTFDRVTPPDDENALRKAVLEHGPIIVGIWADGLKQSYNDNEIHDHDPKWDALPTKTTNHAVLLVGFGTTKAGKDYWIIKNSWGDNWGNKGYLYLARNKGNFLGIAREAVIVKLKKI